MSPQINQILFSAHSSFGFYLTFTIQYSGTTMFTTQKVVFFYFSVCKEGFKMCILNTAVELSAFYVIYQGLPILYFSHFWIPSLQK